MEIGREISHARGSVHATHAFVPFGPPARFTRDGANPGTTASTHDDAVYRVARAQSSTVSDWESVNPQAVARYHPSPMNISGFSVNTLRVRNQQEILDMNIQQNGFYFTGIILAFMANN
ncbi:MAG: hypothetical protein HQL66_15660 [Magnetococcales bacterium]|nr:hypothetical protein [Magnetococcales bacterium]